MPATLNTHRSVHAPFTIPDEQLEFWGRIYCSAPRRGSFEQFLAAQLGPRRGLLPRQRDVQARVDGYVLSSKEREALRKALRLSVRVVENGHFTEKLRHRRWPRGFRDFIPGAK